MKVDKHLAKLSVWKIFMEYMANRKSYIAIFWETNLSYMRFCSSKKSIERKILWIDNLLIKKQLQTCYLLAKGEEKHDHKMVPSILEKFLVLNYDEYYR